MFGPGQRSALGRKRRAISTSAAISPHRDPGHRGPAPVSRRRATVRTAMGARCPISTAMPVIPPSMRKVAAATTANSHVAYRSRRLRCNARPHPAPSLSPESHGRTSASSTRRRRARIERGRRLPSLQQPAPQVQAAVRARSNQLPIAGPAARETAALAFARLVPRVSALAATSAAARSGKY